MIRKTASYILLIGTYCFTWLVAALGHMIPRRRWKPNGRILVTGTIFNPNWYLSHITPLTRCGVKEVILVIDEPMQPLDKVRFICPPKWLAKLISRAGAKAIWVLYTGIRYRPDLFMGYNLVAGSCTALVVGSILGRPACYQMTGGQRVLSTFYYDRFDGAGKVEQSVSTLVERLAVRVIRQFDLTVIRGEKARTFLSRYGVKSHVAIITGSVKEVAQLADGERQIDLIFVGRLVVVKQVEQFIACAAAVARLIPSMRACVVGEGPLMKDLKACVEELGYAGHIEFLGKRTDIERLLTRSKVFVLTSKSEGLSIALAEAMSVGTVPVVADIGELGDLVSDGVNGYLITPNQIDEYKDRIVSLLQDERLWKELSHEARETARRRCSIEVVSGAWQQHIQAAIDQRSGIRAEESSNWDD